MGKDGGRHAEDGLGAALVKCEAALSSDGGRPLSRQTVWESGLSSGRLHAAAEASAARQGVK